MEVWDDPTRHSRDDIAFLMNYGYEAFEYQAGATIPPRLRESYEHTNLLFVHPSKARGLPWGQRVPEGSGIGIRDRDS